MLICYVRVCINSVALSFYPISPLTICTVFAHVHKQEKKWTAEEIYLFDVLDISSQLVDWDEGDLYVGVCHYMPEYASVHVCVYIGQVDVAAVVTDRLTPHRMTLWETGVLLSHIDNRIAYSCPDIYAPLFVTID